MYKRYMANLNYLRKFIMIASNLSSKMVIWRFRMFYKKAI